MLCRKILMNVAVTKGAEAGKHFAEYVEWLLMEGYAPRGSEGWVKYIKDRGNEANHQIVSKEYDEAVGVLLFTEQLLRNLFGLPSLVPTAPASRSTTDHNEPYPPANHAGTPGSRVLVPDFQSTGDRGLGAKGRRVLPYAGQDTLRPPVHPLAA